MEEENKEPKEEQVLLSAGQVDDVLQFSNGLCSVMSGYGFYANSFTQNQNLVALNNNQQTPTYEKILEALQSSPYDWESLCGYSEFMEVYDTIYGKTLKYLNSLLSFNISYYPEKEITLETMKDEEFKKDYKRVEKFLRKFDYKQEFGKIVSEVLRHETSYVWFRDSHSLTDPINLDDENVITKRDESFALQIMPQNRCKLTGYFNSSSLLYDFDMSYFLNGTIDIDLFAPALKKKFKEIYKGKNQNEYNPSAQLRNRDGMFAMWSQVSPNDGAYAFKMDISNFRQVPPFASLMKATFDNTTIEQLQKDKDIASAYALLMGEIKTMTDKVGNKTSDQWAISPKKMGQFLATVQSGLQKNVRPVALPLENNRFGQFTDSSPLMSSYKLSESASQGASASPLIYNDGNMAQFSMQQAIETDYKYISKLYRQFEAFLNFFVNKKTKKYKFVFYLDGLDREWWRSQRLKDLTQLATNCSITVDEQQWANHIGMKPQQFRRSLEMAHYSDFTTLLTPLLNLNTMSSSNSDEVGNVKKDDTEVSDNGAIAREYD